MNLAQIFLHLNSPSFMSDPTSSMMIGYDYTTYMKDRQHKYISGNDLQTKIFGLGDSKLLIGMNDFDLLKAKEAQQIRQNDIAVVRDNQVKVLHELFTLQDTRMIATSVKTPLLSSTKKIIGVAGISIIQTEENFLNCYNNEYDLTKRQLDCLLHTVKGKTVKQIATALSLSPRTVGHYLETIKLKMDCYSKSDLIEKALRITYIKNCLYTTA